MADAALRAQLDALGLGKDYAVEPRLEYKTVWRDAYLAARLATACWAAC